MSRLPPGDTSEQAVVAVLCADLHISQKPPLARSSEADWYLAMERQLVELRRLTDGIPLIIAGDLFDRWNPPVELVNFALKHFPSERQVFAIPGQHDLPNHSYQEIKRSAYWTLVEAGRIIHLSPKEPASIDGLRIWGFPFGYPIQPLEDPHDLVLEVAVVHAYWWVKNTGYQDAPEEARVGKHKDQFLGYDVVVIGDNHTPWHCRVGSTQLWNNGGFYRRKIDEIQHKPSVGLLHVDGTITRHFLDVSKDQFLLPEEYKGLLEFEGMAEFIAEVGKLGDSVVDFQDALKQFLHRKRVHPKVKKWIVQALEKKA